MGKPECWSTTGEGWPSLWSLSHWRLSRRTRSDTGHFARVQIVDDWVYDVSNQLQPPPLVWVAKVLALTGSAYVNWPLRVAVVVLSGLATDVGAASRLRPRRSSRPK